MKSIDLGETGPGSPVSMTDSQAAEPYYPTAHIVVPEDKGDLEMPDEGTVTFKYKLSRETTVKRGGKTVCEYDLKLTELVNYKGAPKEKKEDNAGEALDKLAAAKSKENAEDRDEGY